MSGSKERDLGDLPINTFYATEDFRSYAGGGFHFEAVVGDSSPEVLKADLPGADQEIEQVILRFNPERWSVAYPTRSKRIKLLPKLPP